MYDVNALYLVYLSFVLFRQMRQGHARSDLLVLVLSRGALEFFVFCQSFSRPSAALPVVGMTHIDSTLFSQSHGRFGPAVSIIGRS